MLLNIVNKINKDHHFVLPQRKEIVLCLDDLLMDHACSNKVIRKIIKLIHKESVRLNRKDVLENMDLHLLLEC